MKELTGIIAEIREFCLHDGPGVRTTVFFRGCPMRCLWCHNPELRADGGGKPYTVPEAAGIIMQDAEIMRSSGGGVTFSGGEVLMQSRFACELADRLSPLHLAIETSGYGSREAYRQLVKRADLIYQDIKCMDETLHRKLTGCGNREILQNIRFLQDSGKPYIIRIPIVPGMNDDKNDLAKTAGFLRQNPGGLLKVELLSYHAGAVSKMRKMGLPIPSGLPEKECPVDPELYQCFARLPGVKI
ncbi:MAG: radical SAM protein [Lentisphaerae bacterium]|nr:radical SAM protein [Lentisphaerota bacterium]